jgi:hypothetical protein
MAAKLKSMAAGKSGDDDAMHSWSLAVKCGRNATNALPVLVAV